MCEEAQEPPDDSCSARSAAYLSDRVCGPKVVTVLIWFETNRFRYERLLLRLSDHFSMNRVLAASING
ncbi:hypothetical protein PCCS19_46920 [Paenibacillus sp. CCS19]|nr:hypothetical protein PCCS19_46920 [Paenibacillus cellulosilyticus]